MTLNQFALLGEHEQAGLLENAVKLAEREDEEYKYELFEHDTLYIEVTSTLQHNVEKVLSSYNHPDKVLAPYLIGDAFIRLSGIEVKA